MCYHWVHPRASKTSKSAEQSLECRLHKADDPSLQLLSCYVRRADLAGAPVEVVFEEEVDWQPAPDVQEPKHHVNCQNTAH